MKILYLVFLVLVIWVFIYYVLRVNGMIQGRARVSYPLSDYHISDAHLYASYLSFTFVAYFEYFRKVLNHGKIHSSLVLVFTVAALILTGSKTGLLILMIYSFVVVIRFRKYLNTTSIKFIIVISLVVSIMSFIVPQKILENKLDVIIVSVAALGLGEEWLGRHLDKKSIEELLGLAKKYRFNAVGEGGDLDTLVLDGPLYANKLEPIESKRIWYGDRGKLEIPELRIIEK